MLPSGPHEEYLELCAVSTSGQLTEEEQNRLKEHPVVCYACREALREYESVVNEVIFAVGAEQSSRIDPGPGFSQARAEKAFFDRLAKEKRELAPRTEKKNGVPSAFRRVLPIAPQSTWRHVWMLCAAGILLFITLYLTAYWVGVRHGTDVAKSTPPALPAQATAATESSASLEEQLSDAAHERELARAQLVQRDKALADLRRQFGKPVSRDHAHEKAQTSWKPQ